MGKYINIQLCLYGTGELMLKNIQIIILHILHDFNNDIHVNFDLVLKIPSSRHQIPHGNFNASF